jgi:hypothetical protein
MQLQDILKRRKAEVEEIYDAIRKDTEEERQRVS